jgi:LPXTG-site transpeptidase (sortase) family protein
MKIRKLLFIIGVALVIAGVGVVVWFFARNQISQQKMESITQEFMEELAAWPEGEIVPIEYKADELLVGSTIGVLEFPKFANQRVAIKEGATNEILRIAAGHMTNTEQIWEKAGTSAIAAHNDTFFKNIKDFEVGDKIIAYTREGVFEYVVYINKIVEPTDLSVLDDIEGQKTLTLITCNFSGSKRVIIMAKGGEKIGEVSSIMK